MTPSQLKDQLSTLLDRLSPDQAALVLDFAILLHERQPALKTPTHPPDFAALAEWDSALATAEAYWFQLPESVRQQYWGQTVALLRNRIVDADVEFHDLRVRMAAQHPNQPILFLDAAAEQEPALVVRSPRFR